MNVAAGSRLGPYEIVAPLGAGGMGEVWRARDTRLNRSVAVKVLPSEFSADAHLKARFEREARAISHLTHPHICSLFDVGHDSGVDFLVMEMIEGQTLADRIARGPLPLDLVIRYGVEIAEALEHAHRSGITHRDLKPQNIMITKTGAKLLDFGLARLHVVDIGAADGPTAQKPLTHEGAIVGTFQYMSPEQLEGKAADPRSDIFALGAVLYEMATGRRAFDGKTKTSVIAAIVSSEPPPMSQVQPLTPHALEDVIRGCIAKDPDARIQSAHDVALQLRWIADAAEILPRKPARQWLPWAVAGVLAVLLAAGVLFYEKSRQVPRRIQFTIAAPPGTAIDGVPAVSPDGKQIVFRTVTADSSSMLWIRSVDATEPRPLKGTEEANFAFWSPDAKNIGFTARGKLWRLDLANGDIRTVYEPIESPPAGATWNRDDAIVFAPRSEGTLLRVSASGGNASPVVTSVKDEVQYWPWFLPDGDHFLYGGASTKTPETLYAGSLGSPQVKAILRTTFRAAYGARHLFFVNQRSLYAQAFDPGKLELRGEPVKIDDDIQSVDPGRSSFSVSDEGTLVYRKSGPAIVAQFTFVDRAGRKLATAGEPAAITQFELSPDERRIVYMRQEDLPAVWMLDIARGTSTEVVFGWSGMPVWLPDGRAFAYSGAGKTPPNLFLRKADGSTERLLTNDQQNYPTSVTPDGRLLFYEFNSPETKQDIYAMPLSGDRKPFPVVKTPFDESQGNVSPDGHWLAFTSNESGTEQVYAVEFPGAGGKVQISSSGGAHPHWSPDGRELFYVEPATSRLMAVKADVVGGEMRPSVPVALFTLEWPTYDVTRDGRFLVLSERVNPTAPGLTVVVNCCTTR